MDMKNTRMSPKQPPPMVSPAAVPSAGTHYNNNLPPQPAQLLFLHDRHYGLHGEILLFFVVGLFSIFLVSIILLPRIRRARDTESGHEHEDSTTRRNRAFFLQGKRRRIELDAQEVSLQTAEQR